MNDIHVNCIIDPSVEIGVGNKILPNTIIYGPAKIGDNNIIGPGVVIGMPGQDTRDKYYESSHSRIEIGSGNIIREFTSIQKPCYEDVTKIGNNTFLMHGIHIPHDAILQDDVVVTPGCVLAGVTKILRGASLGISSAVHQRSVIGHYSMISMSSCVTKNIRPFTIYTEGKKPRLNRYAIEKFGFSEYMDEITKYVRDGVMPESKKILDLVLEFETLHTASKRTLYE